MRKIIYKLFLFVFIATRIVLGSERKIRSLPFPDASTVGILAAIDTPIETRHGEVFFSYNFECNYNSPVNADFASLGAVEKYDIKGRSESGGDDVLNETISTPNKTVHSKVKRGLASYLSRKIVYDFLESKMQAFGLNGRQCLLKTICQVADIELGRNNGVLGDLVHVIFTPSTSKDRVASRYVHAEQAGLRAVGESCSQYNSGCPLSLLDFISVTNY